MSIYFQDMRKKKNIVWTPSLACGYYKDGNEIKAGNPLEFYIGRSCTPYLSRIQPVARVWSDT